MNLLGKNRKTQTRLLTGVIALYFIEGMLLASDPHENTFRNLSVSVPKLPGWVFNAL